MDRMKRTVGLLMALVLALSLTPGMALAGNVLQNKSGYCGGEGDGKNLSWTYDASWDNMRLTISGTGKMKDYGAPYSSEECAPWHNDLNNMVVAENVVIKEGVTSIGSWAFANHDASYGEFVMPSTLTSIGEHAFDNAIFPSISIPNNVSSIGNWAFSNSTLPRVTVPGKVTTIGEGVFYYCTELADVTLPNTLTSIGPQVFEGCESLRSIDIPNGVTTIGDSAFMESGLRKITIPSGVTSLGYGVFYGCTSLKEAVISSNVLTMDGQVFSNCSGLTSVTLPDKLKSIEFYTFFGCSSLPSITIPSSVETIDYGAFQDCISLKEVVLPGGVTAIMDCAFSGCRGLKDVYFAGSEAEWNQIDFGSDNDKLLNATIHYNSTGPNDVGNAIYREGKIVAILQKSFEEYLFANPATSTELDKDLAFYLCALAFSTYEKNDIKRSLYKLGFTDVKPSEEYDATTFQHKAAYTLARKKTASGKNIIFISVRGSSDGGDWNTNFGLGAWTTLVNGKHEGFMISVNNIIENLKQYLGGTIPTSNDYVYVITGHSLGGGVGNLLAVELSDSEIGVPNTNVYNYNFANSDVAKKSGFDWNPGGCHNNIKNICNENDVVPHVPGVLGIAVPGAERVLFQWGKFGITYWFKAGDITQGVEKNHMDDAYLKTLSSQVVYTDSPGSVGKGQERTLIRVMCPVDVYVYDGDKLVASVIDNVGNTYGAAFCETLVFTNGDQKLICLPPKDTYQVRLSSTDDGTMTYEVINADLASRESEEVKTYDSVVLETGKEMYSMIEEDSGVTGVQLFVVDESDVPAKKVMTDGTERPLNGALGPLSWAYDPVAGTVTVTGDITSGSAVLVAAYSDEGQMLSVGTITQSGGTASVPLRAETIKLFWTDRNSVPLCASAEL